MNAINETAVVSHITRRCRTGRTSQMISLVLENGKVVVWYMSQAAAGELERNGGVIKVGDLLQVNAVVKESGEVDVLQRVRVTKMKEA